VCVCGCVSLGGSDDISDDDDDDGGESRQRYDRRESTRDADDLQQSLQRRRLVKSQSVRF